MLLVCRTDLGQEDLQRLGALLLDLPHEVRWARRGGRLVLVLERADAGDENVQPLIQDAAVDYVLRDPSPKEVARLLSRRDVVGAALVGTGALVGAAFATSLGVFLASPAGDRGVGRALLVATLEEFPVGSARSRLVGGEEFLIIRTAEHDFRAVASTCTHSNACLVRWDAVRGELVCPCHRGTFDLYGNVTGGPPPRPLATREVEVRDDRVYVIGATR